MVIVQLTERPICWCHYLPMNRNGRGNWRCHQHVQRRFRTQLLLSAARCVCACSDSSDTHGGAECDNAGVNAGECLSHDLLNETRHAHSGRRRNLCYCRPLPTRFRS